MVVERRAPAPAAAAQAPLSLFACCIFISISVSMFIFVATRSLYSRHSHLPLDPQHYLQLSLYLFPNANTYLSFASDPLFTMVFCIFCISGILFLYMPVSASPSYLIPARPSSEHISLFSSDSLALLRFDHNSISLTLLFSYSRNCLALAENAVKAAYTPKALLGRLNKNCNE